MRLIFLFFISLSAFADEAAVSDYRQACMTGLSTKPHVTSGSLITHLLQERGAALGATNIGLIELWMKNGETMISKIYFTTDGSDPISVEVLKEFTSRIGRRVHQVERINSWELNLERGGIVIRSRPF